MAEKLSDVKSIANLSILFKLSYEAGFKNQRQTVSQEMNLINLIYDPMVDDQSNDKFVRTLRNSTSPDLKNHCIITGVHIKGLIKSSDIKIAFKIYLSSPEWSWWFNLMVIPPILLEKSNGPVIEAVAAIQTSEDQISATKVQISVKAKVPIWLLHLSSNPISILIQKKNMSLI